ncbi:ParB/RepB/Spo0J family partition protein [Planctomycetes bacterium TBK1r]|uniref:Nucleoid occlusion protein n=1 Tax=Stieleria magnilauensis TaxID=2527963 RepID=A0ABX5XP53_9BACT|nr:Nucleoid occlusion protein [Planctomycetes bacterium TBK1r]
MANTRNALEEVGLNVDESMGLRRTARSAQLSPVSSAKDIGRRPLRTFGSVEVDRIVPDQEQPRTEFDDADIKRLAGSIRAHGQLHPIRVRWNDDISKWIIVSGERRWRATKAAGLPNIDCYFVDSELTAGEVREQQLVENLLRADLKPLEEAKAYQSLMELNGWNGKQVADALRVTTSRISRSLALLDLPTEIQRKVDAGTLPKTSAYEISKLNNTEQQTKLARRAASGELSHANTVNQIKQRRGKSSSKPRKGIHQVFFPENGLKVTVTAGTKVNYHEVELALSEALDEVRHRIRNNIKLI